MAIARGGAAEGAGEPAPGIRVPWRSCLPEGGEGRVRARSTRVRGISSLADRDTDASRDASGSSSGEAGGWRFPVVGSDGGRVGTRSCRSGRTGLAPHLRRLLRPCAGDVAGGAGQHDRLDRASDDRGRARRVRPHQLGRDGVPVGADDRDAAVREARRSVRPQDRAPGRVGRVPDRLGPLRDRAEPARVDRLPGGAGARGRRSDGVGPGDDRRRRASARPWALSGHLRRGLWSLQRCWSADRRLLHDPSLVALDLLHQHPARHRGVRRARADAAVGCRASAPHDRLSRDRPARRRAERDRAPDHARRQHLRLGIRADRRARRDRGRLARRLRLRRETRCRAGAAAGAVPQQRVHDDEPRWADHRVRAVRLDHLPAALPPGRERCQPNRSLACSCCP